MKWPNAAVFAAITILAGCYYHWGVRAAGTNFEWKQDHLGGYYNHLARGFTEGHLYVPVEPDARLLALPDPLDPNAGLDLPKLFDGVLYNRHYYLYHGAGPAVMLFVPWRILTHHDLPENYALYVFAFGGYLCLAVTLLSWLKMSEAEAGSGTLAIMLLALAFCQSIPFLLSRVWVYEVAIGGGYFCIAAGLMFLTWGLKTGKAIWLVLSGLMFGMAVGCRPPLIIASVFATIAVLFRFRRRALPFLIPLVTCGLLIGLYNYERFGSFTDFGLKYQITGQYQGLVRPRLANILPGLHYLLLQRPTFSPVFPWVLISFPPPKVPAPPEYFLEPIMGALFLAPFAPLAFLAVWMRGLRALCWVAVASGCAILFFLTTTGLSTQRYEVDFLPWFVLAAVAGFGVLAARTTGLTRALLISVMTVAVLFGMVVNLALGVEGPYDELMRNKPARYVWIAGLFSPSDWLRPRMNPQVSVDVPHKVQDLPDHYREDLLLVGRPQGQYELFIDHLNGKPVLVSRFVTSNVTHDLTPDGSSDPFHVEYAAATHEMVVTRAGVELIRQKLDGLVAAPAEIVLPASHLPGT